jgi:hypothetical protein
MTEEYNREPVTGSARGSGVFEDFMAMPLEDKISSLFRMEVETLNEMLRAGADCAMSAFEKVGDAISNFGSKLEHEAKAAAAANKSAAPDKSSHETQHAPPAAHPEAPSYPADPGYRPPGSSSGSFE